MSNLAPYLVTIFSLLLQRMQDQMKDTKTPRYCRYFLHTLSLVAATYGGTPVYDVLESLTPDLTTMMVSVWTNNKAGCTTLDKIELREMIVGGAKILCETPVTTRSEIWVQLFRVIFTITEVESGKQGSSNEDEFTFVDEEADAREFDSTYSKLAFAPIPESTPSSEVAVAPAFFASKLGALFGSFPGQYSGLLQSTLSIEELNGLKSFLSLHGVNFV